MTETAKSFLAAARDWIGRETEIHWGRYPVEHEPIRRWCRMVDCVNPLYLDSEYAHKTRWGRCLCPPLMIPLFGGDTAGLWMEWPSLPEAREEDNITPPLPGNRNIGMGSEFEFLKPVLVGDRIACSPKLIDVLCDLLVLTR